MFDGQNNDWENGNLCLDGLIVSQHNSTKKVRASQVSLDKLVMAADILVSFVDGHFMFGLMTALM